MTPMEPRCPEVTAWRKSKASPPRISPRMMRSGVMRRLLRNSSRTVTPPAFDVGLLGEEAHLVLEGELQLVGVLDDDEAVVVVEAATEDLGEGGLPGPGGA